jgi:glycerol uptake facilitator-like aquaporin
LFTAIITGDWERFAYVWIYLVGEFSGGLLATLFFTLITKPWMKKIKRIKELNE